MPDAGKVTSPHAAKPGQSSENGYNKIEYAI